ncbi:hypothetical protein GPALN_005621 [Globodera pallida]|uniref:Transposase n=1 Tax=Globodera pallida TaxID=36090 RepID=A0A183BSW0_GLOPA|nr:hypothetical protein GPALN_005621 [Globodera pallida]
MSKQIRNQWVWRKNARWWRYLPRRDDSHNKLDLDELGEQCATFPDPMPAEAPKLWVAWLYREHSGSGPKIGEQVSKLFGKYARPGEMQVFKNTLSTNKQLWKIKHLIEIRPVTFPDGEPGPGDANHLEVMADGRCVIDRQGLPNPEGYQFVDPSKQFSSTYLASRLMSKDVRNQDVYEDTVYNPENISIS